MLWQIQLQMKETSFGQVVSTLDLLVDKTKKLKIDFQFYAVLLDFDSYSDALFLHTAYPNSNQIPFKVSDLQLTTTLTNRQLKEYIESLDGYEKLYGIVGEAFCLIFKKKCGTIFVTKEKLAITSATHQMPQQWLSAPSIPQRLFLYFNYNQLCG